MHGSLAGMITVQVSTDVQQTTRLTKKKDFCPCVHEIPGFVLNHAASDISGYSTANSPPKPQHAVEFFQIFILSAFYTGDELLRLVGYTKPSEDVTRLVGSDLPSKEEPTSVIPSLSTI